MPAGFVATPGAYQPSLRGTDDAFVACLREQVRSTWSWGRGSFGRLGQGDYFDPVLNVNGTRKQFRGYTTDILTEHALEWLRTGRDKQRPFFLYLSHKAVHYPFQPAPRHAGRYARSEVKRPETMANTEENYLTQPHWVRERRYSIHGIDHMETGKFDDDPEGWLKAMGFAGPLPYAIRMDRGTIHDIDTLAVGRNH